MQSDEYIINIKNDYLVKSSFSITYTLLFTTGALCLIEALTTKDEKIRHIMNVETAISFIACYFYSIFLSKIKDNKIEFKEISQIRYVDWFITTPFMLLSLGLVLSYNLKINFKFSHFIIFTLLNWGMLLIGYLGEIGKINKKMATIGGFILFGLLFYYIYWTYVRNRKSLVNLITYVVFVVLWAIYGITYLQNERIKNIIYNILDLFAKCFVGIGFWAYLVGLFN
jgi:bacteriorhodopsin